MNYRIEVAPRREWHDARGEKTKKQISDFLNIQVDNVRTRDVYTVCADITAAEAARIAEYLTNPVLQVSRVGGNALTATDNGCRFLVVVGYKPGVTDNVGRTAREAIADIIGRKLNKDEDVYSSVEYLLYGAGITAEAVDTLARKLLANELIQTVNIFTAAELDGEIPLNIPRINAVGSIPVKEYNLEVSDDELVELSKKGTLALTLEEMKAIQGYFRVAEGRAEYGLSANPTDVELEVLAQTWSEHCKHKIFSAVIDYKDLESGECITVDGCYKSFIKKSTKEIGEEVDFLVSVFSDNAGVITFNDKVDICYKVETHNSPSALDRCTLYAHAAHQAL